MNLFYQQMKLLIYEGHYMTKEDIDALAEVAGSIGLMLAHAPRSCRFDSQWGHIPWLCAGSPVGGKQKTADGWFPLMDVPLPLPSFLSLKSILKNKEDIGFGCRNHLFFTFLYF